MRYSLQSVHLERCLEYFICMRNGALWNKGGVDYEITQYSDSCARSETDNLPQISEGSLLGQIPSCVNTQSKTVGLDKNTTLLISTDAEEGPSIYGRRFERRQAVSQSELNGKAKTVPQY